MRTGLRSLGGCDGIAILRVRSTTGKVKLAAVITWMAAISPVWAHPSWKSSHSRTERVNKVLGDVAEHRGRADSAHGGVCVDLADRSILFEPGATDEAIAGSLGALPSGDFAALQLGGSRWIQTATDGPVLQGQAFTLTYSFVPDGTVIPGFNNEPVSGSDLFARLDANFPGGRTAWKTAFRQIFDRWSAFTNITYVEVSDDGAAFQSSPGVLNARGDIRIAMHTVGAGPLAYNFYPANGGDMVMDSIDIATFVNSSGAFLHLRNTLAHEHGHGLGLAHVLPTDNTKLMEPFLNTAFDGPQEDDIRGAQFLYGDWAEPNDAYGDEPFLGGPLAPFAGNDPLANGEQMVLSAENLALERSNSADWFGFTAFADAQIAIRVEPVGTVYQQGSQGNVTTVNAKAARNLGLRLWRRVSDQTGQLALLAQIDFNPAGQDEYHPPIRYTTAGYMLLEVYCNDGINDVQRYKVTISNTDIADAQEPAVLRVFEGTTELGDSSTVLFANTLVGQSASKTVTITNNGAGPLEIGEVTVAGPAAAEYGVFLLSDSIGPGQNTQLAVSFTPTTAGQRVAVISVPNNDPQRGNFSFIVSGTATAPAPAIEVSINDAVVAQNAIVEFGEVDVGQTATASLRIRNTGNATLSVTGLSFLDTGAADYASSLLNATLAPAASATSTVSVTPSEAGLRQAQLRIDSNALPATFILQLRTTGLAVQPPIVDCNSNGVADAEDIAAGVSGDCDANSIPDECEPDADGDGAIDGCDTCPGQDDRLDSDRDGTPDCRDTVEPEPADGSTDGTGPDGDVGNDDAGGDTGENLGDDPQAEPAPDADGDAGNDGSGIGDGQVKDGGQAVPAAPMGNGACGLGGGMSMILTLASLCVAGLSSRWGRRSTR